ncbi:hypothetical protein LCGC14_1908060, partial [marine sediment metagenome]
ERGLTFLTPSKRAAHWFAYENFNAPKFGGPSVVKVNFDGRVLRIPKATSIYDAAQALNVRLGQRGYSFEDFREKLAAAGYDAVAFSDKHAGGREALAVFNTASLRFGGALSKATMEKHDPPRSPHRLHDPRSHEYSGEHAPLLEEFMDSAPWITPTCRSQAAAKGQCGDMSLQFHKFLKLKGVDSDLVELTDYTGYGAESEYEAHTVVRVGDLFVDWTARQFDPTAPAPLVLDEEELRAYWEHKQTWTPEQYKFLEDYLAPPKTRAAVKAAVDEPFKRC